MSFLSTKLANLHLAKLAAIGKIAPRAATHVARVQGMGSRKVLHVNADVATPGENQSANGIGIHRVWQGPARASTRGGAPALKRARIV